MHSAPQALVVVLVVLAVLVDPLPSAAAGAPAGLSLQFESAITFAAGSQPTGLAVADFDRDGIQDFAVADPDQDAVLVLLADRGRLRPPAAYPVGKDPVDLAASDLNRDGAPDLAAVIQGESGPGADASSDRISILLNRGDGTLVSDAVLRVPESSPVALWIGDLDQQRGPDVAVAMAGLNFEGFLAVFMNRGDGRFESPILIKTDYYPASVAGEDLDGDQDVDLVAAFGNSIRVFMNEGGSRFKPGGVYPAAWGQVIRSADLDRDRDADLLTGNGGQLSVLMNRGDGTFEPPLTYNGRFAALAVADIDGDGDTDAAGAGFPPSDFDRSELWILLNRGDGKLVEGAPLPTGHGAAGIAILDFDGDRRQDVIVTAGHIGRVVVHHGMGGGAVITHAEYYTNQYPVAVVAADLNRDGSQDLAFVHDNTAAGSVLFNRGDGLFSSYVYVGVGERGEFVALAAADIHGDGPVDLIAASGTEGISVLTNRGDGTFLPFVHYATGPAPQAVVARDLEGDEDIDLAIAHSGNNTVVVLKNLGDGTFESPLVLAAGEAPKALVAVDLDRDADEDLVVANRGAGTVRIFFNRGGADFAPGVDYEVSAAPRTLAALDANHDQALDLVVANGNDPSVSILINRGDGTFKPQVVVPVGDPPVVLATLDVDGDGIEELAAVDRRHDGVFLLTTSDPNTHPDQILSRSVSYLTGMYPEALVAADLDGDRLPDLAVANRYGLAPWEGSAAVLMNVGPAKPSIPAAPDPGSVAIPSLLFSPGGAITYEVPQPSAVRVGIYDLAGRKVAALVDSDTRDAGIHSVLWDGRDAGGRGVASGVYFVRVEVGGNVDSRRLLLIR